MNNSPRRAFAATVAILAETDNLGRPLIALQRRDSHPDSGPIHSKGMLCCFGGELEKARSAITDAPATTCPDLRRAGYLWPRLGAPNERFPANVDMTRPVTTTTFLNAFTLQRVVSGTACRLFDEPVWEGAAREFAEETGSMLGSDDFKVVGSWIVAGRHDNLRIIPYDDASGYIPQAGENVPFDMHLAMPKQPIALEDMACFEGPSIAVLTVDEFMKLTNDDIWSFLTIPEVRERVLTHYLATYLTYAKPHVPERHRDAAAYTVAAQTLPEVAIDMAHLIGLAHQGGQIIREMEGSELHVHIKNNTPGDFVTAVDTTVERFLREELARAYPHIPFLGEESSGSDKELPDLCWVVDPVDGTHNLIRGHKHNTGMSIGLVSNGRVVAGVVHGPFSNETAAFYPDGYVAWNGEPAKQSRQFAQQLAGSMICMEPCKPTVANAARNSPWFHNLFAAGADVRMTSGGALQTTRMAFGGYDGYVTNLMDRDSIPVGTAIAMKTGGFVILGPDGTERSGDIRNLIGEVVICRREIARELIQAINRPYIPDNGLCR